MPITDCGVLVALGVTKKCKRSIGRILLADGVARKRPSARGRILICRVGKERPGADTCAEVAIGDT